MGTDSSPANVNAGLGEVTHSADHARTRKSFLTRARYAASVYGIQTLESTAGWIWGWREYLRPPPTAPRIVKTYKCRPQLPVRVFFPAAYDQTSQATLPTLMTVHGGGFSLGNARQIDEWNRNFSDRHGVLVVSFNYRKAPQYPFPTGLHDIEAVVLAVLADESLPIARVASTDYGHCDPAGAAAPAASASLSRTAILGFSAGGNLALTASQLPSLRNHPDGPRAAISVYGVTDFTVAVADKVGNRPWKPSLSWPRGDATDWLVVMGPMFDWAYVPRGQDTRNPLLSPLFAPRENLPPFVGVISAELDLLAFENWELASRLAREGSSGGGGGGGGGAAKAEQLPVPDRRSDDVLLRVCGREEAFKLPDGGLELDDRRFAFEETWEAGTAGNAQRGGVKWLLVPEVLHGFDNEQMRKLMWRNNETAKDAEAKTNTYVEDLGRWLKKTVWEVDS